MEAARQAPAPQVPAPAALALRPPAQVMRLARMGSFFATRLSFMPMLVRRLCREGWRIERTTAALDAAGYGHAVYRASLGARRYSLVAFSHALDPSLRTDRVIAEAWDATFALFDGEPTDGDIVRLAESVPRQEAGRYRPSELVLSRANKSVRFFDHLVERLAAGRQPDPGLLGSVGYLMRTTAVYGNGKFGIADRAKIADRPEMAGPFQAEMLTVYLIRCFTLDLAEHIARARAPQSFAPLAPALKRHLGIGNATGLGMAPFLVSHPVLINNWMLARETALARVRALPQAEPDRLERFLALLRRAGRHVAEWRVEDPRQSARIARLGDELPTLAGWAEEEAARTGQPFPWDRLYRRAEGSLSLEGQELLVSLLIEPHGELVDALAEGMSSRAEASLDPAMTAGALARLVDSLYGWALAIDFRDPAAQRRFWYVSEEKLEPRLGERYEEEGAEKEMPLAVAREVQALRRALAEAPVRESVAAFLLRRPALRHIARRVQTVARHPYGEIRDNLVGADCLPIDLLRCKLSFFGASKFDPKSDRWTRITMYQGAPLPEELGRPGAEDWCFPVLPASA